MTERKSRAEKARDTQSRLVEQARALFLAQGFAATSTREVAAAAGVTERTLFNIVASKSDLLRLVMVTDVFDQTQVALLERADFAPVRDAVSLEEFVAQFARWVARLHERTARLAEVIRAAAAVEPAAAEMWAAGNARQVSELRDVVRLLLHRGWLPEGLGTADLPESLAVLTGHETYWRLVSTCRWQIPRYRDRLHRLLLLELAAASIPTCER